MKMDDLVLVSTDDHVVEPPDMFDGLLPARFAARAPRVVSNAKGQFNWVFDGRAAPSLTTSAVAGRGPDAASLPEPTTYADVRPGTYDVHERVKDMNANGVWASLCYPSFPRFAGQLFAQVAADEPELALAVLRAYNDWHVHRWCAAYPGRFIPCALVPIWDPALMADEVRRMERAGCHAVTFSMNPYLLGLPSLHDDHWNPFWAACDDVDTVVCMHIGSSSYMVQTSPDAPMLTRLSCSGINIFPTAADLVWSPVLRTFPRVRFALAEGGIGWVPYFLERVDHNYRHIVAHDPGHPFYGELPSTRFLERFVLCFIEDAHGLENLDRMNVDNVTWESDYPHADSAWPLSPEETWPGLATLDDATIDKITHLNAMRIFRFDPFVSRPKQACTVGALRAEAAGHDTAFIPGRQWDLGRLTQAGLGDTLAGHATAT